MLKNQYGTPGLQDVTLSNTLSMDIHLESDEQFVQIMNKGNCHWLTISNTGCGPAEVNIFR